MSIRARRSIVMFGMRWVSRVHSFWRSGMLYDGSTARDIMTLGSVDGTYCVIGVSTV
jgi:hypothetical protein